MEVLKKPLSYEDCYMHALSDSTKKGKAYSVSEEYICLEKDNEYYDAQFNQDGKMRSTLTQVGHNSRTVYYDTATNNPVLGIDFVDDDVSKVAKFDRMTGNQTEEIRFSIPGHLKAGGIKVVYKPGTKEVTEAYKVNLLDGNWEKLKLNA